MEKYVFNAYYKICDYRFKIYSDNFVQKKIYEAIVCRDGLYFMLSFTCFFEFKEHNECYLFM